jgi:tetratricopeptide (TPR) repeat protein
MVSVTTGTLAPTVEPVTDEPDDEWERRLADAWADLDDLDEDAFRARIEAVLGDRPPGDAIADFERAAAFDSTGHSDRAVPLYRTALATGLTGIRRRRAAIQLASSLRNLGEVTESVDLLIAELSQPSDELDDAVRAVLALALLDAGRPHEAVSHALIALAPHLPRYQRSMATYARLLVEES